MICPRRIGMICLSLLLTSTSHFAALADRPNVVIVITDDQGYGDLSCHGNPVLKTPNLDALHRVSLRLTDYHVTPTCSPTRAAFQTGHWTDRTGAWHTIMGRSLLRPNEVTMGQMFQEAGYATGMFGKWHLGDNYPYRPEDRGYDEVMRNGGGGVSQTPDYWDNAYFDDTYFHNGTPEKVKGFCTDVWFSYARRFITRQHRAGRPFLCYLATNAPHGPMHSPTTSSQPYESQGVNVANFFGMVANIDDNVGKLRSFLREEGLEENTIFIFTTDNGTSSGDKVFNASMRGKKGSEYDGGHRVPFFCYWPAAGLTGGKDIGHVTAHVDVLPTLLDLCDIEPPTNVKFDGRSLRPLLEAAPRGSHVHWPDRLLVTDSQRVLDPIKWRKCAVMSDRWRLVNGEELYDMTVDPSQEKDLAARQPEVVQRLRAFYEDWWQELEPTFKEDCSIYLGDPKGNPATLTCHDWIAPQSTPWHFGMIRAGAANPGVTGYWNVLVVRSGTYRISLRRWPREADTPLRAGLPPGPDVPGVRPNRARPGKAIPISQAQVEIGGQKLLKRAADDAKEVTFQLKLNKGKQKLTTRFILDDGSVMGAYYAYVEKIDD